MTGIAGALSVAVNTVRAWISVLVASHLVLLLPPYHASVGKRLVKRPKVYLLDAGLACHLTGLRDLETAISGPMGGALFETAVVAEVHRALLHRGLPAETVPLGYVVTPGASTLPLGESVRALPFANL